MTKQEEIVLLLKEAREQLYLIKELYENSILNAEFNPRLHPKIKNFLENLRSSFEYTAHIIFDKYNDPSLKKKIQFPICKDFSKAENQLKRIFPNLRERNQELFDYLLESQSDKIDNDWLKSIRDLSNLVKHNEFPIQVKNDLLICSYINKKNVKITWEFGKVKLINGKFHLSDGGTLSMSSPLHKKYKDPLDVDFYGWKIKTLSKDDFNEFPKDFEVKKITLFKAGNFYFDFDNQKNNVYSQLFNFYDRTWRKINLILAKLNPDEERLYKKLQKTNANKS